MEHECVTVLRCTDFSSTNVEGCEISDVRSIQTVFIVFHYSFRFNRWSNLKVSVQRQLLQTLSTGVQITFTFKLKI